VPVVRSARITCFYVNTYDIPILPVIQSSSRNSRWRKELRQEGILARRGHHAALAVCAREA
jgi:hypothetical protein